MVDQTIYDLLSVIAAILVGAYVLGLLARRLGRRRPELAIGRPIAAAFALRVLAAAAVSLAPIAQTLRGGDELGFLAKAHTIAGQPLSSEVWTQELTHRLYEFVFAAQI